MRPDIYTTNGTIKEHTVPLSSTYYVIDNLSNVGNVNIKSSTKQLKVIVYQLFGKCLDFSMQLAGFWVCWTKCLTKY